MDIFLEKKAVDEMRAGDAKKFVLLYDEYFDEVYKYVARRVEDNAEREKIIRLTFLDAFGQTEGTPDDFGYLVWLFSLAKPRVWDAIATTSVPERRGLIYKEDKKISKQKSELLQSAEKIMSKMSLEEREILRLKFLEQVSDADVAIILSADEAKIGTKIYRVLKRAHFLLFGEPKDRQPVYFGELSAFFERLKDIEEIEVPTPLKLLIKADIEAKIDRKDFAVAAEVIEERGVKFPKNPVFTDIEEAESVGSKVGANDPAKIFADAAKDLSKEEVEQIVRESYEKEDLKESLYSLFDRFKVAIVAVPVILFLLVGGFVGHKIFATDEPKPDAPKSVVQRGYFDECGGPVYYGGELYDGLRRSIGRGVTEGICGNFEVKNLYIKLVDSDTLLVRLSLKEQTLAYKFGKDDDMIWKIKKYEKLTYSNDQPGKV